MRMRTTLLLIMIQGMVYGQSFRYPKLVEQGKSTSALVPKRWKLIDSVSGDLNNDHRRDIALILEYDQEVRESRAYGDSNTEIITEIQRPRMLAIYFKTSSGGYRLSTQNNHFILRSQEGGAMGDPLRPSAIANNQLTLSFEGGGEWQWKLDYAFKYRAGSWVLERAGNSFYHEASGEINVHQYDFLRKTKEITSGSKFNRESANVTSTKTLPISTLRTFHTFKKPWTWQIGPDELL